MNNKESIAVCTPIYKKKYPCLSTSATCSLPDGSYIDLRKVVAVDTPESKDAKSFRIYFDNAVWRLDVRCYNEFISDWLQVWNALRVNIGINRVCTVRIVHVQRALSPANWNVTTSVVRRNVRKRWSVMTKVVEKCGFSAWGSGSFRTYLLFGCFWVHINKRFRWPLVSFVKLPF